MKAQALTTPTAPWPAALAAPLYDPSRERQRGPSRSPHRLAMTPIELRIGGGDGPAAIAILE